MYKKPDFELNDDQKQMLVARETQWRDIITSTVRPKKIDIIKLIKHCYKRFGINPKIAIVESPLQAQVLLFKIFEQDKKWWNSNNQAFTEELTYIYREKVFIEMYNPEMYYGKNTMCDLITILPKDKLCFSIRAHLGNSFLDQLTRIRSWLRFINVDTILQQGSEMGYNIKHRMFYRKLGCIDGYRFPDLNGMFDAYWVYVALIYKDILGIKYKDSINDSIAILQQMCQFTGIYTYPDLCVVMSKPSNILLDSSFRIQRVTFSDGFTI